MSFDTASGLRMFSDIDTVDLISGKPTPANHRYSLNCVDTVLKKRALSRVLGNKTDGSAASFRGG